MSARVLVVDDQESMRDVLVECLEFGGYEACSASTGEEGMEALDRQSIGLVITDHLMPGMNGFEFTKLIRESYDIPVIMLTGMGQPDEADSYVEVVDAYLSKPIGVHELLDKIESVLQGKRLDDASSAIPIG